MYCTPSYKYLRLSLLFNFSYKQSHCTMQCHRAMQRKSHLCIMYVFAASVLISTFMWLWVIYILYSQDRSTYFLQQNRQTDGGNIYVNRSQTHECGNWDCGREIPFRGIYLFRIFGVGSLQCAICATSALTTLCTISLCISIKLHEVEVL